MLSYEIMGLVALFVLWGNTALVGMAALKRARELWERRARLAQAEPIAGTIGTFTGIVRGEPGDAIAELSIEQVGRHGTGRDRSIVWHDRRYVSRVSGGIIDLDEDAGPLSLPSASDPRAEVWVEESAVADRASCVSTAAFDAAYPAAKKARGTTRQVTVPIVGGERVWVSGEIAEDGDTKLTLAPHADVPLLISTFDPAEWCAKRAAFLAFMFVPSILVGVAVCTAIALWPPVFGTVSKVGGFLGFIFFLLVLPAGTRARDYALEPHRRILRGKWLAPEAADDAKGSGPTSASQTRREPDQRQSAEG